MIHNVETVRVFSIISVRGPCGVFPDHPDEVYSTVIKKAKTIAGGCLAQARRGTTSGPKGCGQEVRN